jgi:alkanesulfonate monooxygenase SsuD/methylene tetrahydromethanopterin reductase-like flavin-dependent oxidoreductase (luciferase family)
VPFDHRIARFEEAFTIIRSLLREGAVDFEGTYYQTRNCELLPRGPRPAGPPLMIGSIGERMLRITVPFVDSWNAWFAHTGNRPAGVAALREKVDDACREAGREPSSLARTVAVHVRIAGGRGRTMGGTSAAEAPLVGTAEAMAEELLAYAAEGISEVQVIIDPITRESIEEFAHVLRFLDDA